MLGGLPFADHLPLGGGRWVVVWVELTGLDPVTERPANGGQALLFGCGISCASDVS